MTDTPARDLTQRRLTQAIQEMQALGIHQPTIDSPNGDTLCRVQLDQLEQLIRLAWKGATA